MPPLMRGGSPQLWVVAALLSGLLAVDAGFGQPVESQQESPVLSGIVHDERGRPVEGVSVRAAARSEALDASGVRYWTSASDWASSHGSQVTVTDAAGGYSFDDLPPGEYVVMVYVPHWSSALPRVAESCIAALPWLPREYEYADPFRIDPVNALVDRTRRFEWRFEPGLVPPAADGPRSVYVTTYAPSAASLDDAVPVRVATNVPALANIELQLSASVRFAGRLVGLPAPRHAHLLLTSPTGMAWTFSQPDGTFVFMDVPVGNYRFWGRTTAWSCDADIVSDAWESDRDWSFATDVDEATITLTSRAGRVMAATLSNAPPASEPPPPSPDTAAVLGRVTSTLGAGIDRAVLRLDDARGRATATAVTDEDGRYRVTNVPAGVYLLTVSRVGWEDTMYGQTRRLGEGTPIALDGGDEFIADIVMRRHGTITGVARDRAGQPISEAMVWSPFASTFTDDKGQYRLRGVLEGQRPVMVRVSREGVSVETYYPDTIESQATHVDVVGGRETAGIDFSISLDPADASRSRRSGSTRVLDAPVITSFVRYADAPAEPTLLQGRVNDQGDTPMAGVTVVVFSADRTHWTARTRRVRAVRPRSDGHYSVAGMPAGHYKVAAIIGLAEGERADAAFFNRLTERAAAVTLVENEPAELDVDLLTTAARDSF